MGSIRNNFLTQSLNQQGVIAVKLWIRGLPTVITIDDYIPTMNGGYVFDSKAPSGALWGVFLEKVWAKVNGNYEFTNYGW